MRLIAAFVIFVLLTGVMMMSIPYDAFSEKGGNGNAKGDPQSCDNTKGKSGEQNPNCNTLCVEILWFLDSDGDEFGGGTTQFSCVLPGSDWTLVGGDCNDTDPNVFPGQGC